jgi:hypothetical protein
MANKLSPDYKVLIGLRADNGRILADQLDPQTFEPLPQRGIGATHIEANSALTSLWTRMTADTTREAFGELLEAQGQSTASKGRGARG